MIPGDKLFEIVNAVPQCADDILKLETLEELQYAMGENGNGYQLAEVVKARPQWADDLLKSAAKGGKRNLMSSLNLVSTFFNVRTRR